MMYKLPDVQVGLRKGRGTRDQIANICWIIEKATEFQKHIYFFFIDYAEDFDCEAVFFFFPTKNCGKFFQRWEYQITLIASWKTCMQINKQKLEPDMEQQTRSKLGKKYIKAVYCHPAYLTYMQSTSWEMLGWNSTSWNQDCREK